MLNFGGFLSSNFWTNYRCQSSASIEDLLNSKDCTVDKLLDDDDCLQEFKNFNDKLIKYFDHDKLKVMIDYITVMPNQDVNHSRGHKYPFISSEIFNCEINQILDKFFEEPVKATPAIENQDEDASPGDDDKKDDEKKSDGDNKSDGYEDIEDNKSDGEEMDDAKPLQAEKKETEGGATNLEAEEKPSEKAEAKDEKSSDAQISDEVNPQVEEEKKASPEKKEEEEKKASLEKKEEEKKASPEKKQEEEKTTEDKDKNTQEPESEEQEKENKDTKDSEASKEPEGEENTDVKEAINDILPTDTTANTTLATEATEADDEEEGNKYLLLDRLFKFIKDEETLNPVLSGYFCKLVSLLISRKQKSLVPYIYAPNSEIIECLLKHVYQRSVSEILNKLLTQIDSEYEPEIQVEIQKAQELAVSKLILKLGPEEEEETNLNASTIIQDMFETKEFYSMICKKENIKTIFNFATAPINEGSKASKYSSLQVFSAIITQHVEKLKKKDIAGEESNNDEDDDMIVQQNSDDEAADDAENSATNAGALQAQSVLLAEILNEKMDQIITILRSDHEGVKIQGSITDVQYVPLGQQRLLTVELVYKLLQVRHAGIYAAFDKGSSVFKNIIELVKTYQWNNFLQLKVMNMFEEVLDNCENVDFKKKFLVASGIGQALVEMGEKAEFKMESERMIRNGYMGLVVNISNKLQKKYEGVQSTTIVEYLDNVGEEWRAFVNGELKNSNEKNNMQLGGTSTNKNADEDEEKEDSNYDVQMEKIMARFTNFNSILSQGSSNDDDDEEDDDDTQDDKEDKFEDENDNTAGSGRPDTPQLQKFASNQGTEVTNINFKEPEPLQKEFIDNNFWRVESDVPDLDDLLAELEA